MPLRLYLALGGFAVLIALGAALYWRGAHDAAARLKPQIAAAQAQATYEHSAGQITDRTARNTRKAQSESEEGRRAIQDATDVDTAVGLWADAIARVRASGHEPVSDPDPKRRNPSG